MRFRAYSVHRERKHPAPLSGLLMGFLIAMSGCPNESSPPPPPSDPPAPWEASWSIGQPSAERIEVARGMVASRAITHLHSPHSHDACDGQPQPDGGMNNDCLSDLRWALCTTHIDTAFLSDHPAHFAEADWGPGLLLLEDGDTAVDPQGQETDAVTAVGKTFSCDNGHTVLWLPGVEDELMPLGLSRHPGEGLGPEERDALYNRYTPETVATLQEADALVFQAHAEGRSVEDMLPLGLTGIEIYNLHANVDPNIRETFLGLERLGFASAAGPFITDRDKGLLQPDLLFLAFYEASAPALANWDALLSAQRTVGIAGTDAHQNVLNLPLADGERVDSYRRMLRWFSNLLILPSGPVSPQAAKQALASGRSWVAFEGLGTPTGLDFSAELPSGEIVELGQEADFLPGTVLRLARPSVLDAPPEDHPLAPELELKILRIDGEGTSEIARGEESLEITLQESGTYRAEVWLVPSHLEPLLPGQEHLIRSFPWLYANPLYLR